MAAGDPLQLRVVGRQAGGVRRDHAHRPGTDQVRDRPGVHGAGVGAHVGEDGDGAGTAHRVGGCGDRVVGDDHFVARLDAEPEQRQVERVTATAHRARAAGSEAVCQLRLQCLSLRALAGEEHLGDGGQFPLARTRVRQGYRIHHERTAAAPLAHASMSSVAWSALSRGSHSVV